MPLSIDWIGVTTCNRGHCCLTNEKPGGLLEITPLDEGDRVTKYS